MTRHCPECHALHRPAPTCPECGHEYPVQSRRIEQVDGTLTEIRADDRRLQARREQSACRSLEDLKDLAAARGYSQKWAEHVWAARQNRAAQWPRSRQWR